VAPDLATDVGLLEDVHALQGERIDHPDVGRDAGQIGRVAERRERVVEIVHRVADLVDRQALALAQLTGFVERLLLEEAPRAVRGVEELAVGHPLLLVGGEHGSTLGRLELVDDLDRPPTQRRTRIGRGEPLDHQEAVLVVAGDLLIAENTCHRLTVAFAHMDLTGTQESASRAADDGAGPPRADVSGLSVLGATVRHAIDHVEVFPAPAHVTRVRFVNDELNSMCPVTEQPDLSHVVIEYEPDRHCVESKSLKLYLWSFRDRAVFAEALAAEIAAEVMATARPHRVCVTLTQRPRGGIEVQAVSEMARTDTSGGQSD
jgi:7-cyano-7-deazaguanine reductase